MIGQTVSERGKKYNVIILAGGKGTRMGASTDHMPKALATLGDERVIDHIITRHLPVAGKFIIGTGWHADLLEAYVAGRYPGVPIEFSREQADLLKDTAISALLCLDHADSRMPTLVTFCDLLVGGPTVLRGDTLFVATDTTTGNVGTFRHTLTLPQTEIQKPQEPIKPYDDQAGVVGYFDFADTAALKAVAYGGAWTVSDFTWDIVRPYFNKCGMNVTACTYLLEFGTENDIKAVRELWKNN